MKNTLKNSQAAVDRTSEVQMSLKYAQAVASTVKQRRRESLLKRLAELESLPVTHIRDTELRDDLVRQLNAELKQLEEDP